MAPSVRARWRAPCALERPRQEGVHPLVDLGAEAADLALRHAACAHRLDQIVHRARRDTVDIGLLDHCNQGLLRRAAGLEEAWKVTALAQPRDLQRDPTRTGIPVTVAVSIALHLPHRRSRALGRACPGLNLGVHDPFRREGQHLAHKITISLLLNKLDQRHSLFGHRHLRCRFQVSQPEPSPKIGGDRQRHQRPRAALRRRLRARPPTPPTGTLSNILKTFAFHRARPRLATPLPPPLVPPRP